MTSHFTTLLDILQVILIKKVANKKSKLKWYKIKIVNV